MLKPFCRGARFAIFFVEENDGCPVDEFLKELKNGGLPQQQDYETLVERRMKVTAEHGPPFHKAKEQCKELEDGIFEFKAGNGSRVLWFYDKNRVIICSHGFQRPSNSTNKAYRPEIDAAKATRERYREWLRAFEAFKAQKAATASTSRKERK